MTNGGSSTEPLLKPVLLNQIKFSRYNVTCLTGGKLARLSHPLWIPQTTPSDSYALEESPPEVEVKMPWRSILSWRAVSTAISGVPG